MSLLTALLIYLLLALSVEILATAQAGTRHSIAELLYSMAIACVVWSMCCIYFNFNALGKEDE